MKNKILKITLLVFVVGITIFLISYSYAIYRNSTEGNGNIKLADWNVSLNQSEEPSEIDITKGEEGVSYTVKVKSLSEVDIKYSIEITDIPNDILVKLDNGEYTYPTNNKLVFDDVGTILYSSTDKENEHILTFKADNNTQVIEDQNININVKVEQDI